MHEVSLQAAFGRNWKPAAFMNRFVVKYPASVSTKAGGGQDMTKQILKLNEVIKITRLSRSTIYSGVSNNTFPKPIKLSKRLSGWLSSDIDAWIEGRIEVSQSLTIGEK